MGLGVGAKVRIMVVVRVRVGVRSELIADEVKVGLSA